jgi:hypothetical protein
MEEMLDPNMSVAISFTPKGLNRNVFYPEERITLICSPFCYSIKRVKDGKANPKKTSFKKFPATNTLRL